MLSIVDYGMGNLRSVAKAFEHLGCPAQITRTAADIERADRLVLPGVGAFADAMEALNSFGLVGYRLHQRLFLFIRLEMLL